MKNFLIHNWFKLVISLALLSASGTVIWYYGFRLPSENGAKSRANQVDTDRQKQVTDEQAQPAAEANNSISDTSETSSQLQDIQDTLEQQRLEIEQQRIDAQNALDQQRKDENTERNCIANGGRYGGGGLCLYY